MKTIITTLMVIVTFSFTTAQSPTMIKDKMKPFQNWEGRWQGEGSMRMGPGDPKKSLVDERIELKLDGTIVVVEGIGKSKDASGNEFVSHHAFGVLSYNNENASYTFNTHLKDGKSATAWFNVIGENNYQWGFDSPQGKIRYTINLDPINKTWIEVGEFSRDNTTWMQFFEMKLTKVE